MVKKAFRGPKWGGYSSREEQFRCDPVFVEKRRKFLEGLRETFSEKSDRADEIATDPSNSIKDAEDLTTELKIQNKIEDCEATIKEIWMTELDSFREISESDTYEESASHACVLCETHQ